MYVEDFYCCNGKWRQHCPRYSNVMLLHQQISVYFWGFACHFVNLSPGSLLLTALVWASSLNTKTTGEKLPMCVPSIQLYYGINELKIAETFKEVLQESTDIPRGKSALIIIWSNGNSEAFVCAFLRQILPQHQASYVIRRLGILHTTVKKAIFSCENMIISWIPSQTSSLERRIY